MAVSEQCLTCRHYLGSGACVAFWDGIPEEIFTGEHDHRQPFPGDGGYRWEAHPDQPAPPDDEDEADAR